jgi:hypothetical protein
MELIFDENKKYKLEIHRLTIDNEKQILIFTAHKVRSTEALITFFDKNNQQFIFPVEWLAQAKEVWE